jgi:hypothetical protein
MTTNALPLTQPNAKAGAEPLAERATNNATPATAPVPDYAVLDAAHRALSASLHPANKADLFALLAGAGIARVTAMVTAARSKASTPSAPTGPSARCPPRL